MAVSVVGSWIENPLSLKATTPIATVFGWASTKALAAALAASNRVGCKSVAAMLPETSNVRMTVPSNRGRLTTLCGRARATTRTVKPITNNAGPRARPTRGRIERFEREHRIEKFHGGASI